MNKGKTASGMEKIMSVIGYTQYYRITGAAAIASTLVPKNQQVFDDEYQNLKAD